MQNEAAVKLGKLRWAGKSDAEKSAHARKMVMARWAKKRKAKKRAQNLALAAAEELNQRPPRSPFRKAKKGAAK